MDGSEGVDTWDDGGQTADRTGMHTKTLIPTDLSEIVRAQHWVVSRPQVLAAGCSQTMLSRLLRNGDWTRLGQGVYATRPPDFQSVCWGGILLADGPAAIGGLAAAHLRGVGEEPTRILVWGERSRTQGPWMFRRGHRPASGALPMVGPEDAVLEACAEVSPRRVLEFLTAALVKGVTTPQRLRDRAVDLSCLKHRKLILNLLPDLADGIQSTLESHFLHQVVRPHHLPEGLRQISLSKGTRSDVVLEEYGVVVELDGRRGHEGDARWRDAQRDNRHLLRGYVTLRFGWHDVVLSPCSVASILAEVLRQRGWKGVRGEGIGRRCSARCTAWRLAGAQRGSDRTAS